MANYEDLLRQLIAELRTSLGTTAADEQIGEAAYTLLEVGEAIDPSLLEDVGVVIFDNSQAFAKADPKRLNTIVENARAAQIQDKIRRTLGQN